MKKGLQQIHHAETLKNLMGVPSALGKGLLICCAKKDSMHLFVHPRGAVPTITQEVKEKSLTLIL